MRRLAIRSLMFCLATLPVGLALWVVESATRPDPATELRWHLTPPRSHPSFHAHLRVNVPPPDQKTGPLRSTYRGRLGSEGRLLGVPPAGMARAIAHWARERGKTTLRISVHPDLPYGALLETLRIARLTGVQRYLIALPHG